jgi:tryptophanyl-tRNA synthetase
MTQETTFTYKPTEHEREKACNSYLMSLVAVGNRKSTFFVRWHCTQALLSQIVLLFANSYSFWWTVSILFTDEKATNYYFGYLFTVIVFNVLEIISTIYCAVQTRKGKHVEVFFFGNVTNLICRS